MNKKFLVYGVLGILSLALVTGSLLSYFGIITTTADVHQAITLDGGYDAIHEIPEPAPGGETFCWKHILTNDASIPVELELETIYHPNGEGIITTYDSVITDTTANPITDFGSRNNEVCGKVYKSHTLDEMFSGEGFQYGYTVLDGGLYDGASPIVAIINLVDGRHIALFPGWGSRTGSHSLQFSETVAYDTGGNNLVDFALYPSDFSSWLYGSASCGYGDFEAIKADTSLLDGNEMIESVSFQHQAADTGETDRLDWMDIEFGDERNDFIQPDGPFLMESGDEDSFCLCHEFDLLIAPNTYTITTKVLPA